MDDYSSIVMRLVTSLRKLRAAKAKLHAARLTSAFDIEPRVRAHERGMKMAADMYVLFAAKIADRFCLILPLQLAQLDARSGHLMIRCAHQ
jgi:hypothetical protein